LPNRLLSDLDDVLRLVLLGVVDEEVAVLCLAKKPNRDELFAKRKAALAAGPERHADEV
jgi:preprotein translocase subunit Sss1